MKYAVKFWGDIDNPDGAPEEYPAIVAEVSNSVTEMAGYTIITLEQLTARKAEFQDEYNAWAYIHCRPKVIQAIRDQIDSKTDVIIATGYIYPPAPYPDGGQFRMDLEHQMSYKGVYDFRVYITFPYTMKGVGEYYLTFQNEQEMTNFILYGFGWMQQILQYGWVLKSGLDEMTCEQLNAWQDPRI